MPHHANKVLYSWLGLPIPSTTLPSSSLKGTEPSNNENNSSPNMENKSTNPFSLNCIEQTRFKYSGIGLSCMFYSVPCAFQQTDR